MIDLFRHFKHWLRSFFVRICPFEDTKHWNENVLVAPKINHRVKMDIYSLFGRQPVHWYKGDKMLEILVQKGYVKTAADARNLGYRNEIPSGYSEHRFKHRKLFMFKV